MLDIPFSHRNFSASWEDALKKQYSLNCSWSALIWAALTVGKREWFHLVWHGYYSAFELAYRAALIYANLMEGQDSQVHRTNVYDSLDPSEKSGVSYFLGITMAKLFAERYLKVPWLMHLDVYADEIDSYFVRGKTRPDLVGQTWDGQWIVIEAKSRTHRVTEAVISKAKDQALNLKSISGGPISLRVALVGYFNNGALRVHLEDPDEIIEKSLDLRISKPDFLSRYYTPFLNFFDDTLGESMSKWIEGNHFRVKKLENVDIEIGITSSVLKAREMEYRPDELGLLGFPFDREHKAPSGVGRDGVFVKLGESWSEDNMLLEPNERR